VKLFLFLLLPLAFATPASARPTPEQMLAEINRARSDPAAYAEDLRRQRRYFDGNIFQPPRSEGVMTNEGVAALDDAIRFLERQEPLPPVSLADPLNRSALAHALDQQRTGRIGHNGSDGSTFSERISRQGMWQGMAAENIAYGDNDASGVVQQLIVDDGVADRGHRSNLFSGLVKNMGAACAGHAQYDQVCVMDFATAVIEKPPPLSGDR
jgi:uncharacterized protein YkwD